MKDSKCTLDLNIPENPTNGDVLIAIFPKAKYEVRSWVVLFEFGGLTRELSIDWWNAPWDGR